MKEAYVRRPWFGHSITTRILLFSCFLLRRQRNFMAQDSHRKSEVMTAVVGIFA